MTVSIEYFTDVLCTWAWYGQVKIDRLKVEMGEDIHLQYRFLPLFAAARYRVAEQWADKDGFQGFNRYLRETAEPWEHLHLHPQVWLKAQPATSMQAHLYLKAAQLLEAEQQISSAAEADFQGRSRIEEFAWQLRQGFFSEQRDIALQSVIESIADGMDLPVSELRLRIESGEAHAALHQDSEAMHNYQVVGSPTLVLNEGRQVLYGNVGYRIMQANVRELMRNPHHGEASWC